MNFDVVIYHKNCRDGICSLWSYHHYTKNKFDIIGLSAGKDPDLSLYDFTNKNILFTDVCPSFNSLKQLSNIAQSITVIDHHETNVRKYNDNKKEFNKMKNINFIFDMKRSACMMTWDYLFENKKRPWFIEHVGDRDIWAGKLKYNDEIIRAIDYYDLIEADKLNKIDKLYKYKAHDIKKLIKFGKNIILINNKIITDEMNYAIEGVMRVKKHKYRIWVGSIKTDLISDYGNMLALKKFDDNKLPDFVVIWNYNMYNDSWYVSLRGNDKSPNLSIIAEVFGGGGHPRASGFRLIGKKLQDIITFVEK